MVVRETAREAGRQGGRERGRERERERGRDGGEKVMERSRGACVRAGGVVVRVVAARKMAAHVCLRACVRL